MNIARGLFRAWLVVSSVWVAGTVASGVVIGPQDIEYPYWQYSGVLRDNGKANLFDRDWNAPFYTLYHSPSAEGLEPEFTVVGYEYRSYRDKGVEDGSVIKSLFPDGSKLFLQSGMNKDDQDYVAKKFWAGRWSRWGMEAGKWALIALCPPLVLFMIGYAGIWIGRGFRST